MDDEKFLYKVAPDAYLELQQLRRIKTVARKWAEELADDIEFITRGATDTEEELVLALGGAIAKDPPNSREYDWVVILPEEQT